MGGVTCGRPFFVGVPSVGGATGRDFFFQKTSPRITPPT